MNKKKLIQKMAVPAAIVFVISIAALLLLDGIIEDRVYKQHVATLNAYLAELTQKNQANLAEIAGKISAVTAEELGASRVVADLQSEFLRENQKIGESKRYLWMSNPNGEFIFGVPAPVFAKLNEGFDRNKEIISKDGYYKDRNDFLMQLVDRYDDIDFSGRALSEQERSGYYYGGNERIIDWRFFREPKEDWQYARERTLVLSAPVSNAAGTVTGSLFLKIDDSANRKIYFTREHALRESFYHQVYEPIFATFAVLSGLFLWFLLPSWVYIDAQSRAVSNPGVWAFISLISLIFGLAIYLITRPATTKSLHCPKCENQLNGGAFCPHCGFDLSSTYCPQCQYPIKSEWAFCPNCRAELARQKKLEVLPEQLKTTVSSEDET